MLRHIPKTVKTRYVMMQWENDSIIKTLGALNIRGDSRPRVRKWHIYIEMSDPGHSQTRYFTEYTICLKFQYEIPIKRALVAIRRTKMWLLFILLRGTRCLNRIRYSATVSWNVIYLVTASSSKSLQEDITVSSSIYEIF